MPPKEHKQPAGRSRLGTEITQDTDIYTSDKYSDYSATIASSDGLDADNSDDEAEETMGRPGRFDITAPQELLDEIDAANSSEREAAAERASAASQKQRQQHARRELPASGSYAETVRKAQLDREEAELLAKLHKQSADRAEAQAGARQGSGKRKWDDQTPVHPSASAAAAAAATPRRRNRWDETPADVHVTAAVEDTPRRARSRWDETPVGVHAAAAAVDATPRRAASRWDETPAHGSAAMAMAAAMATPGAGARAAPAAMAARNQPLSDDDLDALLPAAGFAVVPAPDAYVPLRTPARRQQLQQQQQQQPALFHMADGAHAPRHALVASAEDALGGGPGALPPMGPDDVQYFGRLLDGGDDADGDAEAAAERQVLRLLLRIKNGAAPQRKAAMRQLGERARTLGAAAVFGQTLPLLMAPTLEPQQRHVLVKVLDRALLRLGDLARPHVHRILVVVEPMLADVADRFAQAEARQVISNLSKAAGLPAMLAALRPDVDHADAFVRRTTAHALAVVGAALGVPQLLPFVRALCGSRKAAMARQTGALVVQQTAVLLRSGVLPHLAGLAGGVAPLLEDAAPAVRTAAALALAALAQSAAPYGVEAFAPALPPLWAGVRAHSGRALAAFLAAAGHVAALMEAEHAAEAVRRLLPVVLREFHSPDEHMRGVVLAVARRCVARGPAALPRATLLQDVLPALFTCFWTRRAALRPRTAAHVVGATEDLALRAGAGAVVARLVPLLKDEAADLRAMAARATAGVLRAAGAGDVDGRLEELLVDGLLYAFQEQADAAHAPVLLDAFGAAVDALGTRATPYLQQVASALLWRLNNPSPLVRQHAADLAGRLAPAMHACGQDELLARVSVVLFEYLGEEYPDVLGSILAALGAVVSVIGVQQMQPPAGDLLPRLAPILKNRHEKVQEACLDVVGRIADRAPAHVPPREWMRCCFALLDLLRAPRKAIRRAAVSTFGYIARAIGPQDVLATLLSNLRVQERQNRVCTTVAIAIVAESCAPFTVLPALMNEYRVPELNVQNGVVKSLAFLFEYIGPVARDYVYAVTPLLEDALTDRDLVHRQQAAAVIRHLALAVAGLGNEEPLLHLLNFLWPNIFETSPHSICAVLEAIESCRVCLGPARIMMYALQGLFHPARKVRDVYWRIYNMMFVGAQPALVAYYPRIEDEPLHTYRRYDLEYML
ncbi:hypothetical protein LPJ53_002901 [Coemansia erecta]|uniref:ARM repeat-containing protein n=1 Tax=Coemansia erecta TaxID=147472 RepID=A0A9W7Y1V3_9FUNG|nr:hypothetical protein LPJ53_002901 [Coemansia erecta]